MGVETPSRNGSEAAGGTRARAGMTAVVQHRYGSPAEVLELSQLERPALRGNEILVRVRAAAVAGDDWHLIRGWPYVARLKSGLRRPRNRLAGRDFAGRVEALGPSAERFEPGDEVFGCADGAFAEFVSVSEDALARTPEGIAPERAATMPTPALTALQALRDAGGLLPGQTVLVIGASGGVGSLAVQIARAMGAEVTGVCSSDNVDFVRSLGAHEAIDYSTQDFVAQGTRYDLLVDLVGERSLSDLRRVLKARGTLVMVGGTGGRWFKGTDRWLRALALSPFLSQRLRPLIHAPRREDLRTVAGLLATGAVVPIISARYPLAAVPTAIAHFPPGHGRGRVVIAV